MESHTTPTPTHLEGGISYIPKHLERRGHRSHRHTWREGATHHTGTHLGWDDGITDHSDTPRRRVHTPHRHTCKDGNTDYTDTPGKEGSHITPTHLKREDHIRFVPQYTPVKTGFHITAIHLERRDHRPHRDTPGETGSRHTWKGGITHHTWHGGITHHTDTSGKRDRAPH